MSDFIFTPKGKSSPQNLSTKLYRGFGNTCTSAVSFTMALHRCELSTSHIHRSNPDETHKGKVRLGD
jgi:hypothetical protein